MAKVGFLQAVSEDGFSEFVGEIHTLHVDLGFKLIANDEKSGENSPSHYAYARTQSGHEIRVGSAWEKTIQRGERFGDRFLSLTLDDPSFDRPLNVAAFKDHDGKWSWSIVWRRRQDKSTGSNSSD